MILYLSFAWKALMEFWFSGDESMSENRTRVSQESHIPVEEPGENAGKEK